MQIFRPPRLNNYTEATAIEWVETDGVGGLSASSALGANTRKQHCVLSFPADKGGRTVLVANLQETVVDQNRSYDLSTNAYLGAVHPTGYTALESFTIDPWPTWTYRFDSLAGAADVLLEKQLVMVHGEHTVVVVYRLIGGDRAVSLTVRPLLAFRDHNCVMLEKGRNASNWQATSEFIECRPFEDAPTLFIAHPNAKVETVGMWYKGFLYQRDLEDHLDCVEDLHHPGYLEFSLWPNISRSLIFSTPSPRPVELAVEYLKTERARRNEVVAQAGPLKDPFFSELLRAGEKFVYERLDGAPAIHPGLPWGESEMYRGLLAFPGLMLVPGQFQTARSFLDRVAAYWLEDPRPFAFCSRSVPGQMHVADVPLWLSIAAWRYWKSARDDDYVYNRMLPVLLQIAEAYCSNTEVRITQEMLIEVGHEEGAKYSPILPLGTNALWYNHLMVLSEMLRKTNRQQAAEWHRKAQLMVEALRRTFTCEHRDGLADSVRLDPFWRDETIRASQTLAVGLPYLVASEPASIIRLIEKHLLTPVGLRSLAPEDSRYVGNGMDVKVLPKYWSGSIDATWLGCYCDALRRIGRTPVTRAFFEPFVDELNRRGYGHISGAFAADSPHEPCDYVASASAVAEITRIYARDVLRLSHVT